LTLKEGGKGARSLVFSKDGTLFVSGGFDGVVKVWDTNNGKLVKQFIGHKDGVSCCDISNNNQFVISSSSENTIIMFWDLKKWKEIYTLDTTFNVDACYFSKDSKKVITAHRTAKIWEVSSILEVAKMKTIEKHSASVTWCAVAKKKSKIHSIIFK